MSEKIGIGFAPSGKNLQNDPQYEISSLDPKLSRSNYFDGRLLKASDLTRDQAYLDERLREVGRVIGSGIVRGFEVTRDLKTDELVVWPGLAVATSGRVLELEGEEPLSINLYDAGNLASLNPDQSGRLQRGLYAVCVAFSEIGTNSAEVYPRDLEGERGFQFNAWSEGIEITLIPLRQRLPNATASERDRISGSHSLAARSSLVREFISNPGQPDDIPDDSVALAMIAVEHGRLLWLDNYLVRRPHRHPRTENRLQQDLHRHYQELLNDIIQLRIDRHMGGDFPASQHFRVLPPYGELPKSSLDPVRGRQSWFPSGYEVSIAPVREDDLGAILQESSALDPIDLEKDDDIDIMILVPMSDHQFAWRARQLQHREESDIVEQHTALPHLDALALRLYDIADDTINPDDASIWNAIWQETRRPMFVRRPPRVAETLVSGVVLASGYTMPDALQALPTDPEKTQRELGARERELSLTKKSLSRTTDSIKDLSNRLDQDPDGIKADLIKTQLQLNDALVDQDRLHDLELQTKADFDEITRLKDRISLLESTSSLDPAIERQITELESDLADEKQKYAELEKEFDQINSDIGVPTIGRLITLRGGDARIQQQGTELAKAIGDDGKRLLAVNEIAALIDLRYDSLLFADLLKVAKQDALPKFRDMLSELLPESTPAKAMSKALPAVGLPLDAADPWLELEQKLADNVR